MKSFTEAYAALRRRNYKSYLLLAGCLFLSVLLITAYAVIMYSETVQTILPPGGDSRKQMMMVFGLAVVGCGFFTAYASGLFFRYKSREMGIFLALGARRRQLLKLLLAELMLLCAASTLAGLIMSVPLAAVMWKGLQLLLVYDAAMPFTIGALGFLSGAAFSVFAVILLFWTGWRFVRRTNIIEVLNEQHRSEPVRGVKKWYGAAGIALMAAGCFGGYITPGIYITNLNRQPPFFANLLYLLALAGLYLFLLYAVIHGFGRGGQYRNIVSRSMMKFQGRQTVRSMSIIAILVAGAYFAMFYCPTTIVSSYMTSSQRPYDYIFHYRADQDMLTREDIEQIARDESVSITSYDEIGASTLVRDGIDSEWLEDGTIRNTYDPYLAEHTYLSESGYNRISGQSLDVAPGKYAVIRTPEDAGQSAGDFAELSLVTNPQTQQTLPVSYQCNVPFAPLYHDFVLDDGDYASITSGLGSEWKENWVFFQVRDVGSTYPFGKRLFNAIVDRSSADVAVFDGYNRIEKIKCDAAGEAYWGDLDKTYGIDYNNRNSFAFTQYWKYMPQFRVVDQNDFLINMAVFLILFLFIFLVCFAAVLIISYTRCISIALYNQKVYEDLRHLGANRTYLLRCARGQVAGVYRTPFIIGSLLIFAFYVMILYFNSNSFTASELYGLGINLILIVVTSAVVYLFYRLTLRKILRMLGIHNKTRRQKTGMAS